MVALTTGLAIGSALVSAYGQYKSAKQQGQALEEQAKINFMKANEVLARNDINNELLQESALVTAGTQRAQIAGSGISGSSASSQELIRDTFEKTAEQIEFNTRAAEWEARMVRLGAESQIESAGQIEKAGIISAVGTAGFGIARAVDNAPKEK